MILVVRVILVKGYDNNGRLMYYDYNVLKKGAERMTIKQCNSCKYYAKPNDNPNKKEEHCYFVGNRFFMRNKVCPNYLYGTYDYDELIGVFFK